MGAVLAQVQEGKERAICYASRTLSRAQSKYSPTRRELLALVTFTRHFRHYLLGRKFTIVTDHSALQWLHNFKYPDGIITRWIEKLAAFDYDVRHRPGKPIGHADSLSRIPPASANGVAEDFSSDTESECSDDWAEREAARIAEIIGPTNPGTETDNEHYKN